MSKDPAILFYYSDFIHAVRYWDFNDRGVYITLLCEQADSKNGLIDPEIFEEIIKNSSNISKIKSKFLKRKTGYYNKRLSEILEKRNRFKEKQRDNANMRWHNSGNARGMPLRNGNGNRNRNRINKKIIKIINEKGFPDPEFFDKWNEWIKFRKESRMKMYVETGLIKTLSHLKNISGNDCKTACEIIDQSIANNYAGLFELKRGGSNKNYSPLDYM